MPFIVSKNDMEVKVLGTHFNINAYNDEGPVKVTLLEGSVKVASKESNFAILKPDQQARVDGRQIKVLGHVNTDEVMAWKNGKFQFTDKADIVMIMRQIARWYDIEVEYRGTVQPHFWGSISRDINVTALLKKIESTGGVKFEIEGKKVIVKP